jgi:hypothetical protein
MRKVYEYDQVIKVLQVADMKVHVGPYQGVAVALHAGSSSVPFGAFEGTVIYIPGVTIAEVQCAVQERASLAA